MSERAPLRFVACIGLLTATGFAQQALWGHLTNQSVPPAYYFWHGAPKPFTDHDGDGWRDVAYVTTYSPNWPSPGGYTAICVLSGRNGSVLTNIYYSGYFADVVEPIGDRDGDGREDFARGGQTPAVCSYNGSVLHALPSNPRAIEGRIDLDGDGSQDLLAGDSTLRAFDSQFALRYSLLASVLVPGQSPVFSRISALDDIDNDGCQDYLTTVRPGQGAGLTHWILSGTNGAVIRSYPIPQASSTSATDQAMVSPDMDGDGKRDYVIASGMVPLGAPWVVTAYSGVSGNVIRQWTGPNTVGFSTEDIDVDGVGDVLFGYFQAQEVISGRDGQRIMQTTAGLGASLGVPAGSSFPVLLSPTWAGGGLLWGVSAYSSAPSGTTTTGSGCNSNGAVPAIAVRPVGTSGMRVQTGSAPPSSLAWCAIDAAGSVPQPVALDPLGLVGCSQYVGLGLVWAGIVGAAGIDRGYSAFDLPFRLDATGVAFEAQWLFIDPPTGGYATTRRLEVRVR